MVCCTRAQTATRARTDFDSVDGETHHCRTPPQKDFAQPPVEVERGWVFARKARTSGLYCGCDIRISEGPFLGCPELGTVYLWRLRVLDSRTRRTVGHQSVSIELLRCIQYVMYFEFGEVWSFGASVASKGGVLGTR